MVCCMSGWSRKAERSAPPPAAADASSEDLRAATVAGRIAPFGVAHLVDDRGRTLEVSELDELGPGSQGEPGNETPDCSALVDCEHIRSQTAP